MNTIVKVAIGTACGFVAGWLSRYFVKEKLQKPGFEACTDEEQLAYAITCEAKESKKAAKEKIDEVFDANAEGKEDKKDIPSETPTVAAINTQKINYMKYYDEGGKYDRHSELPKDEAPVVSQEGEFDQDFMEAIENTEDGEVIENLPEIEDSTLQEFYHWSGIPDGEYDTESLSWYEGDDVLISNATIDGDKEEEIKDPVKYMGFDPKTMFEGKTAVDDDPDSLYIKNNRFKTVYEVIRYRSSYNVMKRMEEFGGDE